MQNWETRTERSSVHDSTRLGVRDCWARLSVYMAVPDARDLHLVFERGVHDVLLEPPKLQLQLFGAQIRNRSCRQMDMKVL